MLLLTKEKLVSSYQIQLKHQVRYLPQIFEMFNTLHGNKVLVLFGNMRNFFILGDRYTVGRSLRPVAVAYDPVGKVNIYSLTLIQLHKTL